MENSHSMWPAIVPLYDCVQTPYLLMSLLISGPDYPGQNINVYLQPLLEELELWDVGVETYDAYGKQNFQMHVAVLWTISDFPSYGILPGWSTSGHYSCLCCLDETDFSQLRTKTCYMGYHRFLPKNHHFRKNKVDFNGKEERRGKPRQLSGDENYNG